MASSISAPSTSLHHSQYLLIQESDSAVNRKPMKPGKPVLASIGTPENTIATNTIATNAIHSATQPLIGNTIRTGCTVLAEHTTVKAGIPADAIQHLFADLYKVPELRSILNMAAWMAENNLLQIQLVGNDELDDDTDGDYNLSDGTVLARYRADEDLMRRAIMHEIFHAVADVLYKNSCKTYRPGQKKEYYAAVKASRSAEIHTYTKLECEMASLMNMAFTHYEHKKEWTSERMVRIAEILARDYDSIEVFREKYQAEWRLFESFSETCERFLENAFKTEKMGWERQVFNNATDPEDAPKHGSIGTNTTLKSLATWTINLAVAKEFENVRGTNHSGNIKPAVSQLANILKTSDFRHYFMFFKREHWEAFTTELAVHYAKCFDRYFWSHKRKYDFQKILKDKKVLQDKVEELLEKIVSEDGIQNAVLARKIREIVSQKRDFTLGPVVKESDDGFTEQLCRVLCEDELLPYLREMRKSSVLWGELHSWLDAYFRDRGSFGFLKVSETDEDVKYFMQGILEYILSKH